MERRPMRIWLEAIVAGLACAVTPIVLLGPIAGLLYPAYIA